MKFLKNGYKFYLLFISALVCLSIQRTSAQSFTNIYPTSEDDQVYDLINTQDDGFLMVGSRRGIDFGPERIHLIKTDQAGNVKWRKTFAGNGSDQGNTAIQLNNANYAIAAGKFGTNGIPFDKSFLLLDQSGNEISTTRFPNPAIYVSQKNNGDLNVGTAEKMYTLTSQGQVVDSLDISIPSQVFYQQNDPTRFDFSITTSIVKIAASKDGGFLLACRRIFSGPTTRGNDIFIKKIDAAGNQIWASAFSSEFENGQDIRNILEAPNGKVLFTYQNCTSGRFCVTNFGRLVQFDVDGTIEWQRNYQDNDGSGRFSSTAHDIVLDPDGNWMVSGSVDGNMTLRKFDFDGEVLEDRQFDISTGIALTSLGNGDYAVSGIILDPQLSNKQIYLLKTISSAQQTTDLELSLDADRTSAPVYTNAAFTVEVVNNSDQTVKGVVVSFPVPTGLAYVDHTASIGNYQTYGAGNWTIGTLAAGETADLRVTMFTLNDQPITLEGEIIAADIQDVDSSPGNNNINEDDQALFILNDDTQFGADLAWISFDPEAQLELIQGSNNYLNFDYEVKNIGNERYTGEIPVTFYLSEDRTYDLGDPTLYEFIICCVNWQPQAGKVSSDNFFSWPTYSNLSNLPTGDYFIIARLESNDNDLNKSNDEIIRPIRIINGQNQGSGADLSLEMTVDNDQLVIYNPYVVTLTITNEGNEVANNSVVDVPIPDGILLQGGNEFLATRSTYTPYGDQKWRISSIAPGGSETLQLNLFSVVGDPSINFFAEVIDMDSNDPDSTPDNGNGTTAIEDDEASVSISDDNPNQSFVDLSGALLNTNNSGKRGDLIDFTFTLSNVGNQTATGDYEITTYLSSDQFFDSGDIEVGELPTGNTPPSTSITNVRGQFGVPNLTPGDYYLILFIDSKLDITERNEQNNFVITSFTVEPSVVSNGTDLQLELSGIPSNPLLYSVFQLKATISNTGDERASGVEVFLPVPDSRTLVYSGGNEFLASQGNFSPYSGGAPIWTVGAIEAGATATIEINYFVRENNAFACYAEISAMDQIDSDSAPGNGSVGQVNEDDEAVLNVQLAGQNAIVRSGAKASIAAMDVSVFPNPAQNWMYISTNISKLESAIHIQVVNVNGRIMSSKSLSNEAANRIIKFDVSDWSGGVYFVRYDDGGRIQTYRFVKQRL